LVHHDTGLYDCGNNPRASAGQAAHKAFSDFLDEEGDGYSGARTLPSGARIAGLFHEKSIFNADEDPYDLAEDSSSSEPVGPNGQGNYESDVDAGRIIGNLSEKAGVTPTTWYRVVQDYWGEVITMHPIPAP
jgi:hypothetical protein